MAAAAIPLTPFVGTEDLCQAPMIETMPPPECTPLLMGERVVWIHDTGPEHGTVKWIGKLAEMGTEWNVGVDLDNPVGFTDGRWAGQQLFVAKPKHGLIISIMGLMKENEFLGLPSSAVSTKNQNEYCDGKSISEDQSRSGDSTGTDSAFALGLELGSVVEVSVKGEPMFGVIRWIGNVPNISKLVAGIEMEEEADWGNDGVFHNNRYFKCSSNKAFFTFLSNCRKDSRFLESMNSVRDGRHVSAAHDFDRKLDNRSIPTKTGAAAIGDRIVLLRDDTVERGSVRWLGYLPGRDDLIAGIEFDNAIGYGSGTLENLVLFEAKMGHASFIPVSRLVKDSDYLSSKENIELGSRELPNFINERMLGSNVANADPNEVSFYDNMNTQYSQHRNGNGSTGSGAVALPLESRVLDDKTIGKCQQMRLKKSGSTAPYPRANSRQELFADPQDGSALRVNKLLRHLEVAIVHGQIELAARLARSLAMLKVSCSMVRNKSSPDPAAPDSIMANLFVEDRTTHIGPINLQINSAMTVGQLKAKIEKEFEFPSKLQRWILGKKLASDDTKTLAFYDVNSNGCPIFLYLMASDPNEVEAYRRRLEMYLNALQELDGSGAGQDDEFFSDNMTDDVGEDFASADEALDELDNEDIEMPPELPKREVVTCSVPPPLTPPAVEENTVNMHKKGWQCPDCTLVNPPTRPGCMACTAPRPSTYQIPADHEAVEEEAERLLRDQQRELQAQQDQDKQRRENYRQLMELDDTDVVLNEQPFECSVCFTEIEDGEGIRIRDCLHTFCRDCLANAVEYSEVAEIACPFRDDQYSCPGQLQEREIRALVTSEVYEKHLQKSVAVAESQAENSFHCKKADCKGWCIYEDDVNLFECPVCRSVNCLTCQAIHESLDCKQYQDRIDMDCNTNDDARKTKEMLDKELEKGQAMRCPRCQVIIMKKWGCDWVQCSMCMLEICWVTKGPRWGPRGANDTSGGCRCGVNNIKCAVGCNYCH